MNTIERMQITQVANGWILELPTKNDYMGALASHLPTMIKAIRNDDVLLQGPDQYIPGPIVPMDKSIYVFKTFAELMAFIKLESDQD